MDRDALKNAGFISIFHTQSPDSCYKHLYFRAHVWKFCLSDPPVHVAITIVLTHKQILSMLSLSERNVSSKSKMETVYEDKDALC